MTFPIPIPLWRNHGWKNMAQNLFKNILPETELLGLAVIRFPPVLRMKTVKRGTDGYDAGPRPLSQQTHYQREVVDWRVRPCFFFFCLLAGDGRSFDPLDQTSLLWGSFGGREKNFKDDWNIKQLV